MKKEVRIGISFLVIMLALASLVTGGVGIKWDQESALVSEGEKTCLSYSVYNPWPESTYVTIEPSDELKSILVLQDVESKLVPANTPSTQAIPVKFCFKIPDIYTRDCWISGLICKQECEEEQKVYAGEVLVKAVPPPTEISGTGGSATTMSVSAPLNIKVKCNAHARNFTLLYVLLAIIAAIIIIILLVRKYRKPKIERDKERMKKLQEKIKRESKK